MQINYVWIITILANVLIVTSSNRERPKRDLLFIKNVIDNLFGYNTNNVVLYPVPDYQFPMNVRPDLYINQNMYQEPFPKMLIPSGMLMQPVTNFKKPYITGFNERNYKTTYPNYNLSPVMGKMQRVIPVPNYNRAEVPLVRCHDKSSDLCRKNVSKDKAGKLSSAFSIDESPKFPGLTRETEEINKDDDEQMLASSQFPPYKNKIETPTTTSTLPFSTNVQELMTSHGELISPTINQPIGQPMAPPIEKNNEEITSKSPGRKIQGIKTSTTSPISTVNAVQTNLSSPYAETTLTTGFMQIKTTTPSSSTNVQELITAHAVTIDPAISQPIGQPMAPPIEKNNEEITSKSPVRKIQGINSSTTSPSSTVNVVQTNLSSSYAETTLTTEFMQIKTTTPPSSTNVQELITAHAVTIDPAISQPTGQPMAPPIEKNNEEITSKSPVRKIQGINSSTTSPSSTVNVVQTNLSSSYAETTLTTEFMQIKTTTPPSSTNVQELITAHAVTIDPAISQPTGQPMAPPIEKNNEEITSKSPVRKIQGINSSTTSPSSTVNVVQTNLSSSYAETTLATEFMQIKTSTPPSSTNVQELIASHAVTIGPAISQPIGQPMVPPIEKNNEEITSKSPVRKIQSLKTSTTSSLAKLGQTNLTSTYSETTSSTEIMQLSSSTPSSFTNVQELVETSEAVTLGPVLTTLAPPSPLPVKYIQKNEPLQPMLSPVEKKNVEIKSTSTTRTPSIPVEYMQPNNQDEINHNFNSRNLSKNIYKKNNSNKSNEDSVIEMENITNSKDIESSGDLISQPSLFTSFIDVLNSINPIRGQVLNPQNIDIPQGTDSALQAMDSDDMDVNDPKTDIYPSYNGEMDYLNRSPVNLDEPSYDFVQEEGSQIKSPNNESEDFYSWLTPSDSAREISRGDVPDV